MPFHDQRVWCVANAADAETLARDLRRTWTLCTGFRLGGYLFLNDSTSEDAIQEYAVVKEDTRMQIESVTFGWMDEANRLSFIHEVLAGQYDRENYGRLDPRRIQSPEQHHCVLCA